MTAHTKEQKNKEKHWISFRVKPQEYSHIYKLFQETSCKKLSDYARKVMMQKPVAITYRNESENEILAATMSMLKDINGIGNNFNQAVKKLHSLREIHEFKSWFIVWDLERQTLLNKIEEIRRLTYKIHQQWSQE